MMADASIRSVLLSSLGRFQALLTWVASDGLDVHTSQVPLPAWSDELGRLRVWATNVGAHQEGQSSLDYRLRDASHIRQQIFSLFDDLDCTLSEIEQLFSNSGASIKSQGLNGEDEVELQQLHAILGDVINCLYQISLLIRKPARHDRLLHYDSDIGAAFTSWARGHVSNKFPNADPAIIDRLGSAITKRRTLLKYRERHHQKLARGLDSAIENRENEESLAFSQTLATDFQEVALEISDAASATGVSQTSYAKSLEGGGDITVPAPPKESENQQEFLCPYCFIIITIKDRRDWTHHVFRDFEPYVCIFPDCPKAEELYDSQREWLAHENAHHPRIFEEAEATGTAVCPLCKSKIARAMLEKHIARHLQELALFSIPIGDVEEDMSADLLNTSPRQSPLSEAPAHDDLEDDQLDDTSVNAREMEKEDSLLEESGHSKDDRPLAGKSIESFENGPLVGDQRERASTTDVRSPNPQDITPLEFHMPRPVSFLYSLKLIKPNEAVEHRLPKQLDSLWLPSIQKDSFTVSEDGGWYKWSPGNVQAVAPNERSMIRLFSTVSLIWCPDRQAFLQVPFDCTKRNAAEIYNGIPIDWEGLSFHHQTDSEGRCISMLGYKYERNQLAARASETWMPQLLPKRYQGPEIPEYPGPCHLAGELSILVGLAALSTTSDWMHWVIRNCFHSGSLPTWKPHNKPREPGKSPTHTIRIRDTDTLKQTADADL
jgi:uncharacterized Zn-finger protein